MRLNNEEIPLSRETGTISGRDEALTSSGGIDDLDAIWRYPVTESEKFARIPIRWNSSAKLFVPLYRIPPQINQ